MASRRQRLLEAVLARLQAITVANGFQTNAGDNVFLGVAPEFGPDDPSAAIAVAVGEEVPRFQQANLLIGLPIAIQALVNLEKDDLDQPWLMVEAVIADIKTAIELEDRTFDGLVAMRIERGSVLTIPREPGSTTVGAQVTYIAPYIEGWGTP